MTLALYHGHETLTFPDYTDLDTGRTLTAGPGRSYDVAPASGRLVPDLPAGWFTPLEGEDLEAHVARQAAAEAERLAAESAAAEGEAAEPEHEGTEHDSAEPTGF